MRFTESWFKPEYVWRPTNVWRRLAHTVASKRRQDISAYKTAWGATLFCNPRETIGISIAKFGIYDLVTTETLARLVDECDICVDVGANIGYTAILMARCAYRGAVFAFEPHPTIIGFLKRNIEANAAEAGHIEVFECALGAESAQVTLTTPPDFDINWGLGRITNDSSTGIAVRQESIDRVLQVPRIDVLKIDVEGLEKSVLKGAATLLADRKIRDIVYEHNEGDKNSIGDWLRNFGYQVFDLEKTLLGPRLSDKAEARHNYWEPQNKLATLDPIRAQKRFRARGWRVLRNIRNAPTRSTA